MHTPTDVPSSDYCACGCKRLIHEFKPVIIFHVALNIRITQVQLLKLANKMIEHTNLLGLIPLHAIHVEEGLQFIVPPMQFRHYYFPYINLLTGVYE